MLVSSHAQAGADPNLVCKHKGTLVISAPLHLCQRVEIAAALLSAGAAVNYVAAADHTTPLMMACTRPDAALVHLYLAAGASVDARTTAGVRALHTACEAHSLECVAQLVAAGAEVDAMSADAASPLACALKCPLLALPVVAHLLSCGADATRLPHSVLEKLCVVSPAPPASLAASERLLALLFAAGAPLPGPTDRLLCDTLRSVTAFGYNIPIAEMVRALKRRTPMPCTKLA